MRDIDRNINSYLSSFAKSYNQFNDIAGINYRNLKNIYEVSANVIDNLNAAEVGGTALEPGEYYYQHILKTEVSEGSCLFSVIQNDQQFPLLSYYVHTPISETKYSIIPYHFLISKKQQSILKERSQLRKISRLVV